MHGLHEFMVGLRASTRVDPQEVVALDEAAREEWAYCAGLVIWIYGLPLMRVEQFRRLMSSLDTPLEDAPYAPINQMGHMRHIPTWQSNLPFTPNVDTLYSGSIVELAETPMVFKAPAMPDRYWSLEVADANMSNLPYLGTRATGTGAGAWLFVAPDWSGEVPEGLTLYRCPSNTVAFALRIRIEGEWDTENVVKAQHEFRLTSLENYLAGSARAAQPGKLNVVPLETHDLAFFTTLCRLQKFNPPYPEDEPIVLMMKELGLEPGAEIDPSSIDPAIRRGLVRAADEGPRTIAWKVKYRGKKNATNWNVDLRGGTFGTDYLARAEGSIQGLFVHDAEECTYFHTYHDANGDLLDGSKNYSIRFAPDQIPTTHPLGFWSVTAYNPGYTLIENEFGRYAVQSSDPSVVGNPDGGVTVYTGPEPVRGAESNWIATRVGEGFRLNMRVYLPTSEVISPDTVDRFLPPVLPI